MPPKTAIIIVNYNGAADTLECLASVRELAYSNYEVYVVDNASTDGSARRIKTSFPDVTLIETSTNVGFAKGNNIAIGRALADKSVDFVFLLNNDAVVDPGCVDELVRTAAGEPAAVLGPMILSLRDRARVWSAGGTIDRRSWTVLERGAGEPDDGRYREIQAVDWLSGCALFFHRRVAERIGLLDERFFLYLEDVDWCVSAAEAGVPVIFVPRAKVWHKGGEASPARHYYWSRNLFLFWKKHSRSWAGLRFRLHVLAALGKLSVRLAFFPRYRSDAFYRAYAQAVVDFALGRHMEPRW